MRTFKKGDGVMVYQDPQTQIKVEGRAELIKQIPSTRDTLHINNWKVKFVSDGFVTERLINIS